MKRLMCFVVPLVALFGLSVSEASAANVETNATGSCLSKAVQVSMVLPKTIENAGRYPFAVTQEFDEDAKTNLSSYVSYFKVKLSRGHAYTIWIENTACACTNADERATHSADYDLEIDPVEATEAQWEAGIYEPGALFSEVSGDWGRMSVMTKDEWTYDPADPDFSDPASWTYYIRIEGPCDSFCGTLRYAEGIWTPTGIEENPLVIAPKETPEGGLTTGENKFVTNEFSFCCAADLEYGRRYAFALLGGRADNLYTFGLDGGKVTTNSDWKVDCGDSIYFNPAADGNYKIWALESSSNYPSATFRLRHRLLPTRGIAAHELQGELTVGKPETCTPGKVNRTGNEYYDLIVDDCLYKVTLEKGKKYVVDTAGAQTNLILYVYDSKGNVLHESDEDGSGTGNVRCGFQTAVKGVFYVGLAEKLEDDDVDEPTGRQVELRVDLADGRDGDPDRWDAADDTYEGATVLQPVLGTKPEEDEKGSAGWHQLGRTDWCDVFALGGRKDCAYRLYVEAQDPEKVLVPIKAKVFTMSGKTRSSVKTYGNINQDGTNSLQFVATKDAVYYVELTSSGGNGIDHPNYRVHSVVYDSTTGDVGNLGLLKVWIHGTKDGRWMLNKESVQYRGEMVLPLAPRNDYAVRFASVKNFTTPEALTGIEVEAGKPTEDVSDIAGWYTDTKDYKDDYPSGRGVDPNGKPVTYGATTLSYGNKVKSEDHTLWGDDVADNFSITGKDGYYYDIWLSDQKSVIDSEPDAVFSIANAELGVITQNVTRVYQLPLPTTKAKYILTVSHKDDGSKNTSYTLNGFYANVGAIKFSAAEYKVKDNAAEVKLTVNRTAKDGKVRVKLLTEDGEFARGVERGKPVDENNPAYKFYLLSEKDKVLEWANGDNKAKTVIIKLIPDKYPTFHDFVRSFTVKMEDAFDGSADCYHASFAIDSKTKKPLSETQVTFQESAKKTPGTVQVAPYESDDRIDVKKPVFDVRAGGTLEFYLVRVDGDDGAVTVKVDTSALTGGKGDSETIEWANGETGTRTVSVAVPPATDAKTSKKVTLKLSATSNDKPKFAASSITVNIYNDKFALTMADYAKALPKTCGYTIKEGKPGTWFVMEDGSFTNFTEKGALTFTATGPCTASYEYIIHGEEQGGFLWVDPGKRNEVVIPDGSAWASFGYSFNGVDGYETIYQAVRYGFETPIVANGAAVKAKVAVGKLPDGIKLEQDKATKEWFVRGVPTKAGFYYAEIQDTAEKPAVALTNLAFKVVALRSAIGTFNGLAAAEDEHSGTNRLQSLAQVTLTTATSGKLSAKVALAGKTYSFTSTGFASAKPIDPEDEDSEVMLKAELAQIQKIKSQVFTNTLQVSFIDMEEDDPDAWGTRATFELDMAALPDLKGAGFQEGISYKGRACRDNSKVADWVLAASKFAGYYTTALVPMNASVFELGEPGGNGYLTLTIDAKGKVKLTGALANGTAYSASSLVGNLDGIYDDDSGEEEPAVTVPIYSFKSPTLFGGWLTVRFPAEGAPVMTLQKDQLAGDDDIRWISADAADSHAGNGFDISLAPAGGYYDTVANLQRYYLNNAFFVEFPDEEDLYWLRDILRKNYGDGYDFVAEANPNEQSVDVVGDTISVEKQTLVKATDPGTGRKTAFNDWANCVNAANVKVSFKRATGIVTGTCDLWYEGTNTVGAVIRQNKLSGLKHAGVLLMNRDEGDEDVMLKLPEDVWTAGSVVIPQNWKDGNVPRKWNASFPFNIKAERFED